MFVIRMIQKFCSIYLNDEGGRESTIFVIKKDQKFRKTFIKPSARVYLNPVNTVK